MSQEREKGVWLWLTLILSCVTIVAFIFFVWELVEERFFRDLDYRQLHYLYITRGVSSSLILAGWAAWFVLRERRKSEEELRRSGERHQAMLAHAADAIVLFDSDWKVLEWNPCAASLYGYAREEVLARPLPTLGFAEEEELRSILQRLERGETSIEIETKRHTCSGVWVDVGLRLSSFPDIETGRTVFLEMEKLTSMGRLAAGTAHTLNTPLGAMLLRIEMLQDHLGVHPCREELKRLESSTRFCQEFVQSLLQYSRPSEANLRCVDVAELLDSICTFFRPTFTVRQHRLSWTGEHLSGFSILADRNQMEALFAALLMNALDALSPQGAVCVEGLVEDSRVNLFVRDNGCGIPPDKLGSIFEPFFTTKLPDQGTGLGLSIALNIVEEHGGSIQLFNNHDSGVTVRVSLPLCQGREHGARCPKEVCEVTGQGTEQEA